MPHDPFYYSQAWRDLRASFLAEHPRCSNPGCRLPATIADHKRTRHEAPHLALDRANLEALCRACHSSKTAKYDRGYGNPRKQPVERDSDGWPVWHGAKR
jgi:5-methylcytosine-specific restriction protein A